LKLPFALPLAACMLLPMTACYYPLQPPAPETASSAPETSEPAREINPLFERSPWPLHYPPFDQIQDKHFAPVFDFAMQQHLQEVNAITHNLQPATFENTIVSLENSGQFLASTRQVFANLNNADTNETRQEINRYYAPLFAFHRDSIMLDTALFERIQSIYEKRQTLGLDDESLRLIERYYTDFIRAGAKLSEEQKERLKQINVELAALSARFSDAVLAEVNDSALLVTSLEELAGLTDAQIKAASDEAKARGWEEGTYALTLLNTTGQPLLAQLNHRPTRQRLFEASITRGSRGNKFDTTYIVLQVVQLRHERAQLLGYAHHAEFVLADETAGSTQAVNALLEQLAPLAVANAQREADNLQIILDREQSQREEPLFILEAWDWAYYSEKMRKERYEFDDNQLKPYFELKNVLENGVFFAATKLYGISFKANDELPKYHPDIWIYDVFDTDGSLLSIFIFDPYARPSKRGGAWMSAYVSQSTLRNTQSVIANHLNIPKPPEGEPTLLTWDEVITAFHEFGHALHGLFSNVQYPYFSGTRVPRDFVEFPSQVNEIWADWPEVLENYAKHYQTGDALPHDLLLKKQAARTFNQGFATTEYLAAAVIDQYLHQLPADKLPTRSEELMELETQALTAAGLDYSLVPPRYRIPYFSHIMGGYAAGYYAYIWAEILDANAADWFKANNGLVQENGRYFRQAILSRGGSVDSAQLFRDFIGHDPHIQPLLERRGLAEE